jgi:hypothetical protein|tara:strand:+ start:40 stop:504 length:465 start_codon:yes stop_codon:yes gene_type:complete
MALTTLGNTAFGTSSVVSAAIKDNAVVFNKLDANTAHTDRNQSFTVAQRGAISALGVQTSTVTLNMNTSNYFSLTANGNITIANPSNTTAGQAGALFVTANGSFTTSFGSHWRFATGTAPTMSTSAGKVDRIDYVVQSANTIHAVATIDLLGTA